MGLAIGLYVMRRDKPVLRVIAWWLLIVLAANPQVFGLPGAGVLTNFAVFIALYIPASLLVGALCSWILQQTKLSLLSTRKPVIALVIFVIFGIAGWGTVQRMKDVDFAAHCLVTRPDERAARWISEHTPAQARFLVNGYLAYGGSSVVGSDGGWWLPLLALRSTTLPPLTYSAEVGPYPGYQASINSLYTAILHTGISNASVLQQLREQGVQYIYIGQYQKDGPAAQLISLHELQANPVFEEIYHQDQVWIFKIHD